MRSPLNYLGGKSRLAKRIVSMIPRDHVCYCEAFCGAAWVLFSKPPSQVEVINDMDGELVRFWRVIQNHLPAFLECFKYAVISRQLWEWEKAKSPDTLTDLQRAVRYYYLQRLCFGGRTRGRTFGTGATSGPRLNLSTVEESLLEVHWRLRGVTIECLHGIDCLLRYDRPSTFAYLDPPYFFSKRDYAVTFEDADFARLREALDGLKGRFVLSLNDCTQVRRLFKGFRQQRVSLTYSCSNGRTDGGARSAPRHELLIHNL